jgi:hypothetical protein
MSDAFTSASLAERPMPEPPGWDDAPPVSVEPRAASDLEERGAAFARERFIPADEIAARPLPEPLIDGILTKGTLAVLYGKWGSGKSFTGLDWAASVSHSLPWQGREVRGGRVVYVAAEGAAGMGKRIEAWKQHMRVPTLPGLEVLDDTVNLLDPTEALLLAYAVKAAGAVLVILDTLNRCIPGGDENGPRDMGLLVAAADSIRKISGATVLVIHHVGKDNSLRGHTSLPGAVETIIRQEGGSPTITLVCEKQKDVEEFPPIHLELQVVEVQMPTEQWTTSCVLRAVTRLEALTATAQNEAAVLEALWKDFGSTGASGPILREALKMSAATFSRTANSLLSKGLVANVGTDARPVWKATGAGGDP